MDRTILKGYGERDGLAVVTFEDGRELQMSPEWRGESVRRILSVQLFGGRRLIARVMAGCFWSENTVSQVELGKYCAFAIDLEREVYRHYRTGKITEEDWQKRFRLYWKIVIKSRQIAAALSLEQLPVAIDRVHDTPVMDRE